MRVLTAAGESPTGKVASCPGMSCQQFASRMANWNGKKWQKRAEEACAGCDRCDGTPPQNKAGSDTDEVEDLVNEIEDIVFLANGGQLTDWNEYPHEYYRLFCWWRAAEKEVEELRAFKLSSFIGGFSKK